MRHIALLSIGLCAVLGKDTTITPRELYEIRATTARIHSPPITGTSLMSTLAKMIPGPFDSKKNDEKNVAQYMLQKKKHEEDSLVEINGADKVPCPNGIGVHVVRASNLQDSDFFSTTDPFVVVRAYKQTDPKIKFPSKKKNKGNENIKGFEMIGTMYQTKTISNKIDPVWNEFTHCFNNDGTCVLENIVLATIKYLYQSILHILTVSWNTVFSTSFMKHSC